MLSRLAMGFCFAGAVAFTVIACGDDDDATAVTPTPDAGTADTGANTGDGGDAGTPGPALGAPITDATAGSWKFEPFSDAFCANGATTGMGINLGTSKRLFIYMEGGGACWNDAYCYIAPQASFLNGFGPDEFAKQIALYGAGSMFDRTDANNPWKDASFVYIPYCTGDVHAGNKVQTYPNAPGPTHHVGRANVEAFMKRIAPTFPDADRVILSGSSAGGFGAAINYERIKAYYANTRMDLIDDSGPPFAQSDIGPYSQWADAWDIAGGLPAGCTECQTDISKILPYYFAKYTDARFALLTFDHDPTISTFFYGAAGAPELQHFNTSLQTLITTQFQTAPNAHIFAASGIYHTMLEYLDAPSGPGTAPTAKPAIPPTPVTTNATKTLGSFINDMESDSTSWANELVPPQAH